jgi:hypothetical protein
MSAHPVPGKVFITPTSAAVGGTQVTGIFEDRVEFDDGTKTEHYGTGLEADAWGTLRAPGDAPAALYIPLRDVSSVTMQLLLSLLSTGANMHSHGGGSTPIHGDPPGVALVIRPKDTTQNYLYGPRWKLHKLCEKRIVWSRKALRFEGNTLILAPHRSLDSTKKAFMEDTPANINSHYGL